jgi:hypothetical protein
MILSFILTIIFYNNLKNFTLIISILSLAYILAFIYNILSKKYPGMDFFVAGAIFFLILFGASTVGNLTSLALIVAFIGGIQVLFMNLINGTIKDIDHDVQGLANTTAIKLGVRINQDQIILPSTFKIIGYLMETIRIFLMFIPFLFFAQPYYLWQLSSLFVIIIFIFISIYQFFSIKKFERNRIRRSIGIIVILMYTTTPIMLSSLNTYILILLFIPPIWFIFCNIFLHNTLLIPKTM